MFTLPLIGGLLILCGLVYLAYVAIFRGRMSDAHLKRGGTPTLEPRRRTFGFLSARTTWPALLLIVIGALLLMVPSLIAEPPQTDTPTATDGATAG